MKNRKAEYTNKATDLWVKCFCNYFQEKALPILEELRTNQLPGILKDFYSELHKKCNPSKPKKKDKLDKKDVEHNEDQENTESGGFEYKTSSLKYI